MKDIVNFEGIQRCATQHILNDYTSQGLVARIFGGSSNSIELPEAGVWGHSPQLLRDFQHFNY